jgi:hypothetical protein
MASARQPRVFVKLAHGSAASGVVAYETSRGREQARTTVEMIHENGRTRLYNSRRLRRYTDRSEIARLFDALCPHGVHVEAWAPKVGIDGRACDLRVVVIDGRPAHAVCRLSRGPITNLHLLNRRADATLLRERMPAPAWEALMDSCRLVAGLFPRTLHVGVDVCVQPGWRRHTVLEVNAFGDLLHGVTHDGLTTHEAELAVLDRRARGGEARSKLSEASTC